MLRLLPSQDPAQLDGSALRTAKHDAALLSVACAGSSLDVAAVEPEIATAETDPELGGDLLGGRVRVRAQPIEAAPKLVRA
jgi:hypothetical protein